MPSFGRVRCQKGLDVFFRIDGTGFQCGERVGWGGLAEQKIFEGFRLSTHQRRVRDYGAPEGFGGMGGN